MSDETKKEAEKKSNEDAAVKPDPETLNTTDPAGAYGRAHFFPGS